MPDETIWDKSKGPKPRPAEEPPEIDYLGPDPNDPESGERWGPLEEETPPEPPSVTDFRGNRKVIGPDWFVYGDYVGSAEKGERQRIPYVEGMSLPEGQMPQPPTGPRTPYSGPLPSDIAEEDRGLVGCWGIERFRASMPHQLAAQEGTRQERMEPLRKEFIKEQKKRGKA